jgi:1-acyl-sn-glycerol-3-phosphate acyltransferase
MILLILKYLSRSFVYFFFGRIRVKGSAPKEKSVIWLSNHQSAIADPSMLLAVGNHTIRPLAKHTLWSHPVMIHFLKAVKAVPVVRPSDVTQTSFESAKAFAKQENQKAFDAISRALREGDDLMVFPEGLSHESPSLLPLKTGFARMALQAVRDSQNPDFYVTLQPVILAYESRDEFQSDVIVILCEPIYVKNSEEPIKTIVQKVEDALKSGIPDFYTWEEKRNWHFIHALSCGHFFEDPNTFKNFIDSHRSKLNERPALMTKLQSLRRLSTGLGLPVETLLWAHLERSPKSYIKFFLTYFVPYFFIVLPSQLSSILIWSIPYSIIARLSKVGVQEGSIIATMKIAHGAYIFPVWSLLMSFGVVFYLEENIMLELVLGTIIFLGLPFLVLLSHWASRNAKRYASFLRLAKLRLFFPRAWNDLMLEIDESIEELKATLEENIQKEAS